MFDKFESPNENSYSSQTGLIFLCSCINRRTMLIYLDIGKPSVNLTLILHLERKGKELGWPVYWRSYWPRLLHSPDSNIIVIGSYCSFLSSAQLSTSWNNITGPEVQKLLRNIRWVCLRTICSDLTVTPVIHLWPPPSNIPPFPNLPSQRGPIVLRHSVILACRGRY